MRGLGVMCTDSTAPQCWHSSRLPGSQAWIAPGWIIYKPVLKKRKREKVPLRHPEKCFHGALLIGSADHLLMAPTAAYARTVFFNSLWLLMEPRSKDRDDLYNPYQPGWGIHFHHQRRGLGGVGGGWVVWQEGRSCHSGGFFRAWWPQTTHGAISMKSPQIWACVNLHHAAHLNGGLRWNITSAGGNSLQSCSH